MSTSASSRQLLQAVMAAMPQPIFVLDENGVYVDILGGHDQLSYHKAGHLVGQGIRDIMAPDIAEEFVTLIRHCLDEQRVIRHAYSLSTEDIEGLDTTVGPDGQRWYEANIYPIDTGKEEPRLVVWTVFDVTETRQIIAEKDQLVGELRQAVDEVKTLRGIIPICASCKSIRDDEGTWKQIEEYVSQHSEAEFSHGLCSGCMTKLYPEYTATEKD